MISVKYLALIVILIRIGLLLMVCIFIKSMTQPKVAGVVEKRTRNYPFFIQIRIGKRLSKNIDPLRLPPIDVICHESRKPLIYRQNSFIQLFINLLCTKGSILEI